MKDKPKKMVPRSNWHHKPTETFNGRVASQITNHCIPIIKIEPDKKNYQINQKMKQANIIIGLNLNKLGKKLLGFYRLNVTSSIS